MNNGFGSNKSNWAGSIWGNGTLKKTFGDATNEGSNRRGDTPLRMRLISDANTILQVLTPSKRTKLRARLALALYSRPQSRKVGTGAKEFLGVP